MMPDLFQVVVLFSSGEREKDLGEGRVEDVHGELFQVVVEGVGEEEVKDWSRQQGEGGAKGVLCESTDYIEEQGSTYSERGTHEETLCPQSRAEVRTRDKETRSQLR